MPPADLAARWGIRVHARAGAEWAVAPGRPRPGPPVLVRARGTGAGRWGCEAAAVRVSEGVRRPAGLDLNAWSRIVVPS